MVMANIRLMELKILAGSGMLCGLSLPVSLTLSLSDRHTHTHTYTHTRRLSIVSIQGQYKNSKTITVEKYLHDFWELRDPRAKLDSASDFQFDLQQINSSHSTSISYESENFLLVFLLYPQLPE